MVSINSGKLTRRKTTKEDIERMRKQGVKESAVKEVEQDVKKRKKKKSSKSNNVTTAEKAPIQLGSRKKSFAEIINNIRTIEPGSTRDKIGSFFGGGANRGFEEGETPVLGGSLPLGIPTGAVTGLGGNAFEGASQAVNAIVPTVRSGQGGILGKYVLGQGAKAIEVAKATFTATAPRTATQTISKVGEMVINSKTIGLSKGMLGKFFSGKAMAFYGAWASSVFLGRWGQAEAPEAILIPIRELMSNAKTPEDWAQVDEHLKLAEELSNTSAWEDIILWSPFSAVKGILDKVRGVAEGTKILRETAEQVIEEQARIEEQGGSDFDVAQEERDVARDERDSEFAQSEEDRNTRQDERDEKFTADQDARDAAKERETRIQQEVYRLRREKKFDEADALELTIFE